MKDDLILLLGKQSTDPKSGPYTACCTSLEMAELIVKMIEDKEHLEELTIDQVYKLKKEMPVDPSKFNFHLYNPHDDRRLNITLQMMDLTVDNAVELCCMFHGQSSREVFLKYFQWGVLQRRSKCRVEGSKLTVFK